MKTIIKKTSLIVLLICCQMALSATQIFTIDLSHSDDNGANRHRNKRPKVGLAAARKVLLR